MNTNKQNEKACPQFFAKVRTEPLAIAPLTQETGHFPHRVEGYTNLRNEKKGQITMKLTLENVATAWTVATPAAKAAALDALRGAAVPADSDNAARVLRWREAADRLGICRKRLRDACKASGIRPVILPGSKRAIGVRLADLRAIAGE